MDLQVFGQRLRHVRNTRSLTLQQLGERVDRSAPYLSQLENGRREPTLSLIDSLAAALETTREDLLSEQAPNRRAELEIAISQMQHDPTYQRLGLPQLHLSARIPDAALEHITQLYREVLNRQQVRAATPEEARHANVRLRNEMKAKNNYFADIEQAARDVLDQAGYHSSEAISPKVLNEVVRVCGYQLETVPNLPATLRSLIDRKHRRIFIPQRNELAPDVARSVICQTLGHLVLEHDRPANFGDFLRQRVEANYFAGAILIPESTAVGFLHAAQRDNNLSIEDFAEQFHVSFEMAGHRFTNLATKHLDMPVHFVRSDEHGTVWKAYENDGVPFITDPEGAVEGQQLCRKWGTRQVFAAERRYEMHYQYTDTAAGTYWCGTYLEAGKDPQHAITIGVPFSHAASFRGRDTRWRAESSCPNPTCCRQPAEVLAQRWSGQVWPSPRPHSHVLATLPSGTFPGVDMTEVYEFLDEQTSRGEVPAEAS